jgi:hypothetical protein
MKTSFLSKENDSLNIEYLQVLSFFMCQEFIFMRLWVGVCCASLTGRKKNVCFDL